MATIIEDYVSFETAKLLIKKGFDYSAEYESYYTLGGTIVYFKDNPQDINIAPRITLQMAMKWLREIHDIFIKLEFDVDEDIQWHPSLALIKGNKYIHTNELQWYDTYEQACEAAIKYCLKNLI
jgi:hypothetical protein